jgi:D-alanyl-lipoteichoic acid acyltransferase DltB (MBOAT superfamily)
MLVLIPLYSLQIYADFTGGMDVSLGISHALGIELYENFDAPFASPSLGEYWRRWHRSLGRFFTDYVFYPLSVSRPVLWLSRHARRILGERLGKRVPLYGAMLCTWFLTGLWHGAAWNFIVWGLLNCLVILVSRECEPLYRRFRDKFPKLVASYGYHCFAATRTFLLMGLIRSLDCYANVGLTFKMWGSMFTNFNWGQMLGGEIFDL